MRWLSLILFLAGAARADEPREWTCPPAPPFLAKLVAADGLRATLLVPGRGKAVVPFALLSAGDVQFIRQWRADHPKAPAIDPERLAPWPVQALAESLDVRVVVEDAAGARFRYESAHFLVESDVKLPLPLLREMVAVFEATRSALIALPLGLHLGNEREKYQVMMYSTQADYLSAGGTAGSGGTYSGFTGRMLILLPNLGFKPGQAGFDLQRNVFVLKHEVTHQLMARWRFRVPVWLDEGFCETMAATPYTRARYSFQSLDTAMRDYVLKWRPRPDRREVRIIAPARLMALTSAEWQAQVAAESAYPLYNSSALLVHYFLHHDGARNGAGLAGYFDDLRRGVAPEEAEAQRLLRGRTREELLDEVRALGKKLGLDLKTEEQ